MSKNIDDMTRKELQEEISAWEQHIMITSYGVKDLIYLNSLYVEAEDRGYEVQAEKTVRLVDPTEN